MEGTFLFLGALLAALCSFGLVVASPKTKKQYIWAGASSLDNAEMKDKREICYAT
jgi:hypothetical protein